MKVFDNILLITTIAMIVDSTILLINWYGDMIKEIMDKDKDKVKELSKTFEIERSINEILNNQRAEINRLKQQISNNSEQDKHMKNNNKQTVYKIEKGDLNGNIEGDNIIVILMNGDVNGDINSKEGDVVLIKGDINGDVIANKVICPQQKSDYENYIDKLSSVEKLSKPDKKETFKQPPPDYVRCADCIYAEDYSSNMYRCSKYDGVVVKYSVRICDSFKEKEHHTCKSCYHFVKDINGWSYCSKYHLEKLYDSVKCCPLYDGTGETTNYKCDCARFSNNSGICFSFHVLGCPIKNNCPDKINRSEND